MQIDTSKLKKFLDLNDDEFKQKISDAAKAGGVDETQISSMLKDVKNVKQTIGSLSEDDIKNAINSLDRDKLESFVKNMKK